MNTRCCHASSRGKSNPPTLLEAAGVAHGVARGLALVPLAVAILALGQPPAIAQTVATAAVRGRVTDPSGAPVAGANVELTRAGHGVHRVAVCAADGSFTIGELAVGGGYRLTVQKEGTEEQTYGPFGLRAGETATFEVKLAPARVRGQVTVYGTTGGVLSNSAQLGVRLDQNRIANTPVLGDKLSSLPMLNSAVHPARGTGDLFLNNTLFDIDGGGRRQTDYRIDGATANDSWGRQTIFTNLPLLAVSEMTVLTTAESAEYGRTTGGVVNVITRSGSDQFRGDVQLNYRPTGLEAAAPVTGVPADDKLVQGAALVSGKITDGLYYIVSGEYSDQNRRSGITSPLAGAPGSFTGQYDDTMLFGKLDANLSDSNHAFFRYSSEQFHDTNPSDAVGGLTLPSAARTFRRNTYSGQLADIAVLTPSLFNELSLGVNVGSPITQFEPADPSTQYVRPGVSTEGESRSALLFNHEYQLADTLSMTAGEHSIKAGFDVVRSSSGGNSKEFGGPFVLGQFTFKTGISPTIPTADLTINDVQSFTQGFGNANYHLDETLWAVFVQDDVHLRPNLTLNLGLRYDRQSSTDDADDIAPRLGFAWNPDGDPHTSIRGAFGLYYSEIPANNDANYTIGGPQGIFTFSASPGQLGFPTSLEPLPAFPAGAVLPSRNITIRPGEAAYYSQFFDIAALKNYPDRLLNPRTDLTTLGIEHDFGNGWIASADGVHSRTQHNLWTIDLNAATVFERTSATDTRSGTAADATRPITPVPNGYRQISCTTNLGEAKYDALEINVRKDFQGKGGLWLSYTWSHNRNNTDSDAPGVSPNDTNQLGNEWANSLLDQRHRAVLSGWMLAPYGFRVGGFVSAASGRPYNITTGSDNNGDGSRTDRPIINGRVVGRNAGEGSSTFDLSMFVARDFSLGSSIVLTLRADGFNLTNHTNVYGYNGVYGNGPTPAAGFGAPVGGVNSVDPGREFQFSARLSF
jgi:hypothetical protein